MLSENKQTKKTQRLYIPSSHLNNTARKPKLERHKINGWQGLEADGKKGFF